jgi:hypothetical protein
VLLLAQDEQRRRNGKSIGVMHAARVQPQLSGITLAHDTPSGKTPVPANELAGWTHQPRSSATRNDHEITTIGAANEHSLPESNCKQTHNISQLLRIGRIHHAAPRGVPRDRIAPG